MEEGEGKGWRARRPFFLPSPPLLLLLLLLEIRLIFPAFSSGRNVNEITRRKLEVAELLNLYLLSRARLERSGPVIYPFLFFLRCLTTRLRNMGRLPFLPSPSSPPLFFLRPRAAINFPASSPRRVLPPPKPQEREKDRETDRSDGERESVLLEYQQTTTQHTTTDDG